MATNLPWAVRMHGTQEYREAVLDLARRSGHRTVPHLVADLLDQRARSLGISLPQRDTRPPRIPSGSGLMAWAVTAVSGPRNETGTVHATVRGEAEKEALRMFPWGMFIDVRLKESRP